MDTNDIIRILTIGALAGLLMTVGLRLRFGHIAEALRRAPLVSILLVNFVVVPVVTVAAVRLCRIEAAVGAAMLLLAAAPFAPVVPVLARLARADLALAAALTSVIPLISAFVTPFVCVWSLKALPTMGEVRLSSVGIFLTLMGTVVLPLVVGVVINHYRPAIGQRILRPIEAVSEVAGALSLVFVTVTQFRAMLDTGWLTVLVMLGLFQVFLWLGYALGHGSVNSRRVIALGTSNRNIALALLVALQSFPGTAVVPAVVTNGFLLILLGLIQVGWWRFFSRPNQGGRVS